MAYYPCAREQVSCTPAVRLMIAEPLSPAFIAAFRSSERYTRRGVYVPLSAEALASGRFRSAPNGLSLAADLPGVTVDTSASPALRFVPEMWGPESREVIAAVLSGSPIAAGVTPEDFAGDSVETFAATSRAATDSDLELIRKQATGEVDPSEVLIFERWVANDAVSRSGSIRLTARLLGFLAADFNRGRSVLLDHNYSRIVGRTLRAETVEAKREGVSATWIRVTGYMPVRPDLAGVAQDLRLGVLAYDSVGFMGGNLQVVDMEVPGLKGTRKVLEIDWDAKSESPLVTLETSFVYLGALRGAGKSSLAPTGEEPAAGATKGTAAAVIL